jgi:hypothetical protein
MQSVMPCVIAPPKVILLQFDEIPSEFGGCSQNLAMNLAYFAWGCFANFDSMGGVIRPS